MYGHMEPMELGACPCISAFANAIDLIKLFIWTFWRAVHMGAFSDFSVMLAAAPWAWAWPVAPVQVGAVRAHHGAHIG